MNTLHKEHLRANFEGTMANIRRDGGLVEDADGYLRVRRLGADLEVRIAHALAHGVHTNEGASA
jgi:hypothetical protein